MWRKILQHEWRALAADRSVWVICGLLAGLIGYAAFNGAAQTRFQERTLRQIAADENSRFQSLHADLDDFAAGRKEAKGFLDPRGAASLGGATAAPYLTINPLPLASLSIGQSDLYSFYVKAGLRTRQMNAAMDEIENPVNLLSGRFDLAFVVVYLYPLVILAFAYNLISAEKEQGTLALTLSQPVSLLRIVAGKAAVRGLVIIGLITGLTMVAAALSGTPLIGSGAVTGWINWMAAVFVYGLFWFSVAIAVNSFGRSSSTNAVAVAGIWLLFVLLIPTLINAAASSFYPVPSRVEMIQAMRVATKEATDKSALLLSRYMEDHPDLMPQSAGSAKAPDYASTTATVQIEVDRLIQPVIDQFDRQSALQQSVVERFRFASPAILIQGVLNDISGTSQQRQRNFLSQVDTFLHDWQAYFYPRVFSQAKLLAADVERAPRFQYQEELPGIVGTRVFLALAGVFVLSLIIGFPLYSKLRNYPVT